MSSSPSPPSLSTLDWTSPHRCVIHRCHPSTLEWTKTSSSVHFEKNFSIGKPFALGSLRQCYYAYFPAAFSTLIGKEQIHVAKFSQNVNLSSSSSSSSPSPSSSSPPSSSPSLRSIYFGDVEAQQFASSVSNEFNLQINKNTNKNSNGNGKKKMNLQFIEPFVVELVDKGGRPLCGMERYLSSPQGSNGPIEFAKYNNNVGLALTSSGGGGAGAGTGSNNHQHHSDNSFDDDDDDSDLSEIAQAFSHFSWSCTFGLLLVCDIQGVGNVLTDPQVHTDDKLQQKGSDAGSVKLSFGMGNLGSIGIKAFMMRHTCNSYCAQAGLKTIKKGASGVFSADFNFNIFDYFSIPPEFSPSFSLLIQKIIPQMSHNKQSKESQNQKRRHSMAVTSSNQSQAQAMAMATEQAEHSHSSLSSSLCPPSSSSSLLPPSGPSSRSRSNSIGSPSSLHIAQSFHHKNILSSGSIPNGINISSSPSPMNINFTKSNDREKGAEPGKLHLSTNSKPSAPSSASSSSPPVSLYFPSNDTSHDSTKNKSKSPDNSHRFDFDETDEALMNEIHSLQLE